MLSILRNRKRDGSQPMGVMDEAFAADMREIIAERKPREYDPWD